MPPAPVRLQAVAADDALVWPVLADLHADYAARYPRYDVDGEMSRYRPALFRPPTGAFLVLLADGPEGPEVVAAGGYLRHDAVTAELKRVWTSSRHRRQGLRRQVVRALEDSARAAGYRRVLLTTGPKQPEARALYLAVGYTPVSDHDALVARPTGPLPFVKDLL